MSFFDRSVERLEKVRDMAVSKMNEIIASAKVAKIAEEAATATATEEAEAPFVEVAESETADEVVVSADKETATAEPSSIRPRATKEGKGKINKSELIRDFFSKHQDAANKDCIEFYKKKGIEINPTLVSIVKKAGSPSGKKGRPAKAKTSTHAAVAKAKKVKTTKRGLPMTACIARVVSKNKEGMRIDKIVEGIKKYYTYGGKQDDDGLRNVVYQGLYALSKKKTHRGWKGEVPVVLHDEETHTWRLNPKAERKIA